MLSIYHGFESFVSDKTIMQHLILEVLVSRGLRLRRVLVVHIPMAT